MHWACKYHKQMNCASWLESPLLLPKPYCLLYVSLNTSLNGVAMGNKYAPFVQLYLICGSGLDFCIIGIWLDFCIIGIWSKLERAQQFKERIHEYNCSNNALVLSPSPVPNDLLLSQPRHQT